MCGTRMCVIANTSPSSSFSEQPMQQEGEEAMQSPKQLWPTGPASSQASPPSPPQRPCRQRLAMKNTTCTGMSMSIAWEYTEVPSRAAGPPRWGGNWLVTSSEC